MKGKLTIVFILVSLIILTSIYVYDFIARRKALELLEISIADVSIKRIGLTSATLEITFKVYNPSDNIATLDKFIYSLYIDNTFLGDGEINKRIDIPPKADRFIISDFNVSYSGIVKTAFDAINKLTKEEIKLRIKGIAYLETPLGTFEVTFDKQVSKQP